MQKVKVSRYVSGRRPDYAPHDSGSESSEEEEEEHFGGVADPEPASWPKPPEPEGDSAVGTPALPPHTHTPSHSHTLTVVPSHSYTLTLTHPHTYTHAHPPT